jgi:uncharacterized protein (TIGR03382 family)
MVKTLEHPHPDKLNNFSSFYSEHALLGVSLYTTIEVRTKQNGALVSGSTAALIGHSVFTPDTPLSANTTYTAKATATYSTEENYEWEFTTSDIIATKPSPFEGISIEGIKHVKRTAFGRCPAGPESCSFRSVERGLQWSPSIQFTILPIEDTEHGPGLYNYILYTHKNAQDLTGHPRHLSKIGNAPTEISSTWVISDDTTEICLSLKAYRIDTPDTLIDSTAGIVCQIIPTKPAEVLPALLPEEDLCNATDDSDDFGGCSSAPNQNVPTGLMWLLAVMGLMWRTRRQP